MKLISATISPFLNPVIKELVIAKIASEIGKNNMNIVLSDETRTSLVIHFDFQDRLTDFQLQMLVALFQNFCLDVVNRFPMLSVTYDVR